MSKSNVYSALIEEKISRSKNLFINSSQELEQTTVIMAGSNVVTSLNLSCESLDDEVEFNEDMKNQFIEWHKIALHIFFTKFSNLRIKTKKAYMKAIWDFMKFSPNLEPEDLEPFINFKFENRTVLRRPTKLTS